MEAALQFGALGVLAITLVWIFKVLLPRLFDESKAARDAFREELAVYRRRNSEGWEAFREESAASRKVFAEELAAERTLFRETLTELRGSG